MPRFLAALALSLSGLGVMRLVAVTLVAVCLLAAGYLLLG